MRRHLHLAHRVLLATVLLVGAGCASLSQPLSASFASTVIEGGTSASVREQTIKVFVGEEWRLTSGAADELVFEREASKLDHVLHGNGAAGDPVRIRMRVQQVPLADGSIRLQGQAFAVRDYPTAADDEVRLSAMRAESYQLLLDKVAAFFRGARP